MDSLIRDLEEVLALEAEAHARATLELNPYSEAESLDLGTMRAIYTGAISSVHGVFATGLDGDFEERDLKEIERFFSKKERAPLFWASPATHPTWLEYLEKNAKKIATQRVHGAALKDFMVPANASGNNKPDFTRWALSFTRLRNPTAKEPDLISQIKMHQKNTRYYLDEKNSLATFTFFEKGLAFSSHKASDELFSLQLKDAKEFSAKYFFTNRESSLPFLYERNLYEPL